LRRLHARHLFDRIDRAGGTDESAGAINPIEQVAGVLSLYRSDAVFSTARLNAGGGHSGLLVTEVKKRLSAHADADLEILDGSPGIGCPVIASLAGVDLVLLVAEPTLSGLSDMDRIAVTAAKMNVPTVVCINKVTPGAPVVAAIEAYCETHRIPIVGKIPFDPSVPSSINDGRTIAELDSPAGSAVRRVHRAVLERLGTMPSEPPKSTIPKNS